MWVYESEVTTLVFEQDTGSALYATKVTAGMRFGARPSSLLQLTVGVRIQ
jgi:hypothetical protein